MKLKMKKYFSDLFSMNILDPESPIIEFLWITMTIAAFLAGFVPFTYPVTFPLFVVSLLLIAGISTYQFITGGIQMANWIAAQITPMMDEIRTKFNLPS